MSRKQEVLDRVDPGPCYNKIHAEIVFLELSNSSLKNDSNILRVYNYKKWAQHAYSIDSRCFVRSRCNKEMWEMSGPFMLTRGTAWMSMSKDQIDFGWRRFTKVVVFAVVVVVVANESNLMLKMIRMYMGNEYYFYG